MRQRKFLCASLLLGGLALAAPSAAFAKVVISVDKSTQHMTVAVDGVTRYVWPVSTGRPGYNTPSGTFHPSWMSAMHYSKEYENAPMPDSIFFSGGDAIHGFTDTPFGVSAVSHGCVRLPRADAAVLFQLVKQNGMPDTSIIVHGHIPREPLVAQRGNARREYAEQQSMAPPYGRPYGGPPPAFAQRRGFFGGPYYQQPYGGYYPRFFSPY